MAEIIRLTTEEELRRIQAETIINRTSKVNKISAESILSGISSGNAKIAKKALKDIQLAVSQIFPSTASGAGLDRSASDFGIGARLGSSQSSVVVKFIADPGTQYVAATHTVSGNDGLIFDLDEDITIGTKGYGYVKARSQDSGEQTLIDAFTINSVSPEPTGHIAVTNEYKSEGGRSLEQDDIFRTRIRKGANLFAGGTLAKYTQVFLKTNDNILRVFYQGVTSTGKTRLAVASQNGAIFTDQELDEILANGSQYFSLTELNPTNSSSFGIELVNVTYQYIDISFRCELFLNYDIVDVIKDIQTQLSKAVDFRFWDPGIDLVDRVELLNIVRGTEGIKVVPEIHFAPGSNIMIDANKLPRFRSYTVYDLTGALLLDQSGTIDPIYYPNAINSELDAVAL